MPIIKATDKKGPFYQYGDTGMKYYFDKLDPKSELIAHNKAKRQMKAMNAETWKHFIKKL